MDISTKTPLITPKTEQQVDWKVEDMLSGEWNKLYKIDKNIPLYFKLMDNSLLTKEIKNQIKSDSKIHDLYSQQLAFIERQRLNDLWVKIEGNIVKMNLLDLYNTFLCYLKDKSYEDQLFNINEVSFMGPLGPYSELPLIQCLNDRIINKFIFASVMNNKIPMRSMRLLTEGTVLVNYGKELEHLSELNVKQITDTGILFSSFDEFVIDDMSKADVLKFHMTTEKIKSFMDNNFKSDEPLSDLYYTENELRYFFVEENKMQRGLSYRSDETNEFFLFIRYYDMLESDVPNIFMQFMDKLKDYFHFLAKS